MNTESQQRCYLEWCRGQVAIGSSGKRFKHGQANISTGNTSVGILVTPLRLGYILESPRFTSTLRHSLEPEIRILSSDDPLPIFHALASR